MANYPTSLPSFTGQVGTQTDPLSAPRHDTHHTNQNAEIVAIATELGTDPSRLYATVKDRLDATRQARFKTGRWYYPHGTSYGDTFVPVAGTMYALPMWFNGLKTFDQLGIKIISAGSVGATIRAGAYLDDGDGMPGTRATDWGTIAATTTGNFTWTVNWTPTADLYWIAGVVQGAPTTAPTIRSWQNINLPPMSADGLDDADWGHAFAQTTVTGALPTPYTTTPTPVPNSFAFMFRAA